MSIPSSELGPPTPLTRRPCCPPLGSGGGGEGKHFRLRGRRWADLIRTTGEKTWYSAYSVHGNLHAAKNWGTLPIYFLCDSRAFPILIAEWSSIHNHEQWVQWFWLFFTFWGITTHPWHPKGPRIWKLAKKNFKLHPWPAEIFGKNRKMRFIGLVSKFDFRSPVWQIFTIFSACFIYGSPNTQTKF